MLQPRQRGGIDEGYAMTNLESPTMADAAPAPPIQRLCKYRSMEEGTARERTLAILKNRELRYSPASSFNDPFDCRLDIALKSKDEADQLVDNVAGAFRAIGSKLVASAKAAFKGNGGVTSAPPSDDATEPTTKPRSRWQVTGARVQDDDGQWRDVPWEDVVNDVQVRRMSKLYKILDQSFGVLCLSKCPDDILLWSHYADSHRGLCLEFDVAGYSEVFPRLHAVKYADEYPDISSDFPDLLGLFQAKSGGEISEKLLTVADILADDLAGDAQSESSEHRTALSLARWFYVKSSHWAYEREWRCLRSKPGPQSFPPDALTRIIVGCVDTEATLKAVRDAIAGTPLQNVRLYKAVRQARRFGLDIVPAD